MCFYFRTKMTISKKQKFQAFFRKIAFTQKFLSLKTSHIMAALQICRETLAISGQGNCLAMEFDLKKQSSPYSLTRWLANFLSFLFLVKLSKFFKGAE